MLAFMVLDGTKCKSTFRYNKTIYIYFDNVLSLFMKHCQTSYVKVGLLKKKLRMFKFHIFK